MLHIREMSRPSPIPVFDTRGEKNDSISGYNEFSIRSHLDSISKRLAQPARSTIFFEGAVADALFNIVGGTILLSKVLMDGRRQVVGIAFPGDVVGLAMGSTNAFTATALTEVKFLRIDRQRFRNLLDLQPRLLRFLYETNANELKRAHEHMMLLGLHSAEEKLASFFLSMHERWSESCAPSARVDLPLTRQEIGDYVGLTIETVSRTFTKLAKQKLIAVIPDGIRILDLDGLRSLAPL